MEKQNPPKSGGYFPLFVPAEGRRALVAGGGRIACRRVYALLQFGVEVQVVAPEAVQPLVSLAGEGRIHLLRRKAGPQDVTPGLLLAVAATSDRSCNREIGRAARALGIPVSVADCREESSFFFPAIIQGAGVVGGVISLNGGDHRLAARQSARLRAFLNQTEGDMDDVD